MEAVPNAEASQVEDDVRARERALSSIVVPDVALKKLHAGVILQVGKVVALAVHQIVEHEDRIGTVCEKSIDEVTADESCSSCDENLRPA
ncbi:hypothetical protein GCM10011313_13390 [Mycetocola zhadangensis]|nr:hypothetical protein GCM10011313_13390 [Mycetocola zhadangensis]